MEDNTIFEGKAAAYFTLGCKLNFAETSAMGRELASLGVRRAAAGEIADICIVNTCSVTDVADHKCRQAIHRLVREHPGAVVVVTGCYAQLRPDLVSRIEGVDLVLGQNEKGDLVRYLRQRLPLSPDERLLMAHESHTTTRRANITRFVPSCAAGERTRYFLKVQDGCDYFCTYCTIPAARGRSRSGRIADLVAQVRQAAADGGKEVVLTGVNIGDFGRDTGESFADLLRTLDDIGEILRYRISSIEPNLLTDEVLRFCASSRAFMPHFHIPLQSGSDEVLRLMRRRYDTSLFYNKVSRARELIPDAFVGVDVIVGTRGETEALFDESLRFIESLPVSQLHVFSYSERPGTAALRIPHVVAPEEKHRRSQALLAISEAKRQAFYGQYLGTSRPVLLEHSHTPGLYGGFTDNYIRVELPAEEALDNTLHTLHLTRWNDSHSALMAERQPQTAH